MVLYCILSVPGVSCRLSLSSANGFIRPGQKQNTAEPFRPNEREHSPDTVRERNQIERDANLQSKNQSVRAGRFCCFNLATCACGECDGSPSRIKINKWTWGQRALHELRRALFRLLYADELCTVYSETCLPSLVETLFSFWPACFFTAVLLI